MADEYSSAPSLRPGHHASTDTPDPPTRLPNPLPLTPAIRATSRRRPHLRHADGTAAATALGASGRLGSGGVGGPVLDVFGGTGGGGGGAVAGVCGGRGRRIADGALPLRRQRRAG